MTLARRTKNRKNLTMTKKTDFLIMGFGCKCDKHMYRTADLLSKSQNQHLVHFRSSCKGKRRFIRRRLRGHQKSLRCGRSKHTNGNGENIRTTHGLPHVQDAAAGEGS